MTRSQGFALTPLGVFDNPSGKARAIRVPAKRSSGAVGELPALDPRPPHRNIFNLAQHYADEGHGGEDSVQAERIREQSQGYDDAAVRGRRKADDRARTRQNWTTLFDSTAETFIDASDPRSGACSSPCTVACPAANTYEVTVFDICDSSSRLVTACSRHLPEALLHLQLFPSSPKRPQHAFTFRLMHLYDSARITNSVSACGFVEMVHLLHQSCQADLRKSAISMDAEMLAYASDWWGKYLGRRDRLASNKGITKLERLAELCPLCFGNLPASAQDHPRPPSMPDVFVSLDGNFQHKRKSRVDAEKLADDHGFIMLPLSDVEAMREALKLHPAPSAAAAPCGADFKAADESQSKAAMSYFDTTGLMMMVCRHDVPLFACDIDTPGERQEYALVLIEALLKVVADKVSSVAIMYDIACWTSHSIAIRGLLPDHAHKLRWAVPIFHAYAHDYPCQSKFSPRKLHGFGLTDGEGTERAWSGLSRLIPLERNMSKHRRRQAIEARMAYMGERKLPELFASLVKGRQDALQRVDILAARMASHPWSLLWDDHSSSWRRYALLAEGNPSPHQMTSFSSWLEWLEGLAALPACSGAVSAPGSGQDSGPNGPGQLESGADSVMTDASCAHVPELRSHAKANSDPDLVKAKGPYARWLVLRGSRRPLLRGVLLLCLARNLIHGDTKHKASARAKGYARLQDLEEQITSAKETLKVVSSTVRKVQKEVLIEKLEEECTKLRRRHDFGSNGDAEAEMNKLNAAAWEQLIYLADLLTKIQLETERLRKAGGGPLGTVVVSAINARTQRRQRHIADAIKSYNALLKAAVKITQVPIAPVYLDAGKITLALVRSLLATADLQPAPWLKDDDLNMCMDTLEEMARAVEELAILDSEARACLAWACKRLGELDASVAGSTGSLQWHARQARRRLKGHISQWRLASSQVPAWEQLFAVLPKAGDAGPHEDLPQGEIPPSRTESAPDSAVAIAGESTSARESGPDSANKPSSGADSAPAHGDNGPSKAESGADPADGEDLMDPEFAGEEELDSELLALAIDD